MTCKYRCQECGYEFECGKAGWVAECPKCKCRYMDWLNYKEVLKSFGNYNKYKGKM